MTPHVFDRIEFGCIGRKSFDYDASSGRSNVVFDQRTAMDWRPIPQDKHFSWNVTLEMAEKLNHLRAFDAAGMDLEIEAPKGKAANDGKAFPVEGFLKHRGLSARGPSAHAGWTGAQSAFVNKDDDPPLFAGLFFNAGHSTRFQRLMAFLSRSMARRSGLWQLKPLAPSKRQTCPG